MEARVKHYNQETAEVEFGTVYDKRESYYLVIPDYNISLLVKWRKINCDIIR